MLKSTSVVIGAAALAIVAGLAIAALLPGPQTPIGLIGSAFASPASAQQQLETVEGEVSGYKYSPSGSRIDGFYLDDNGILWGGRTAVSIPPHAASLMPREGSSVAVSGMPHTSPHGEEALHAISITDNGTGQTLGIQDPAAATAAPPHGGPGIGPAIGPAVGPKGAKGEPLTPPPPPPPVG